jgi:hypothetical protein
MKEGKVWVDKDETLLSKRRAKTNMEKKVQIA